MSTPMESGAANSKATEKPAAAANARGRQKGKKGVDSSVFVMGGLTLLLVILAYMKGPDLPLRGLQTSWTLLQDVWLPLLLGFLLAGFFDVLVPREFLVKWMGEQSGTKGISDWLAHWIGYAWWSLRSVSHCRITVQSRRGCWSIGDVYYC